MLLNLWLRHYWNKLTGIGHALTLMIWITDMFVCVCMCVCTCVICELDDDRWWWWWWCVIIHHKTLSHFNTLIPWSHIFFTPNIYVCMCVCVYDDVRMDPYLILRAFFTMCRRLNFLNTHIKIFIFFSVKIYTSTSRQFQFLTKELKRYFWLNLWPYTHKYTYTRD